MGWGSKTTTTNNQAASSTSTPTELPYIAQARQALAPAFTQQLGEANKPVFGQAQIADYMSNLNDLTNSSIKSLHSNLSSQGLGLSGASENGDLQLQQQRLGGLSSFFGQLPFQEQAAHLNNLNSALGSNLNYLNSAPRGNESSSTSNSNQTQQTNPGLSGLVSGLAGIGFGGLTGGLSSMLGGGSFGGGFGASMSPTGFGQSPMGMASNPFSGGYNPYIMSNQAPYSQSIH